MPNKRDFPSFSEDSQRHLEGCRDGLSQIAPIPKGFGELQNYIASQLTKSTAHQLAVLYNFPTAQRDEIYNSEKPGSTFVEMMLEKGLILEDNLNLEGFLKKLRDNDLGGIAERIQRRIASIQQSGREDGVNNVIPKRSEAEIYESHHHSFEAPALEKGGNNATPTETLKRKSDLVENTQQRKKVKREGQNVPSKEDAKSCDMYFHFLIADYRKLCTYDKALLIGVASEITADLSLQRPKKVYMIRRERGMNLKAQRLYNFENVISLDGGKSFLIGPHTTPSIVSVRNIKHVDLHQYDNAVEDLKSCLNKRKFSSIPSFTLKSVKYEMNPKQPVLSVKGVIKDISHRGHEDDSTPRRVVTIIDSEDCDFLSVVLHENHFPISERTFEKNSIVELQYFETAQTEPYKSKSNFLASTKNSVIREIEDDVLNHLKVIELTRAGRGKLIEGTVTKVRETVRYKACPNNGCYLKEVTVKEDGYYCPKCRKMSPVPKEAYYIKLTVDCSGEEYNGVIFTPEINELKKHLQESSESSFEEYLESLPDELLDWRVTANYTNSPAEGMNNVFNNITLKRYNSQSVQ